MTYHSGMGATLCPPNFKYWSAGKKCVPANARGCYEAANLWRSHGVPEKDVQGMLSYCLAHGGAMPPSPVSFTEPRLRAPRPQRAFGEIPPVPTCITQAQHDAAVAACKRQTVRGIGADVSYLSPCVVKDIPVCPPLVRANFPTATYAPPVDISTPPEPPPEESEPNYMLWGGLGLLLAVAGGYVVYKSTRK